MSEIPSDLRYTESHEWIRVDGDLATIGITDHAQTELTDLVFVELPELGKALEAGDACAVVESVKTASDIYSPLAGEVSEINETLADDPGRVNASPYEDGWFFKLKLSNPSAASELLTPEAYGQSIGQ